MSPPGKQEMGKDGKNGFDACAKGTVQEKCEKGRGLARLRERRCVGVRFNTGLCRRAHRIFPLHHVSHDLRVEH